MKKILLVVISFLLFFSISQTYIFAQTSTPTPGPSQIDGKWVQDQEVTFVGKTATRADDFLNWSLENYDWVKVNDLQGLQKFSEIVRNIVLGLLLLFILVSAFVIIITRGQNLTIMKFVPRFIFILLLVVFSFSLVKFLYDVGDIIQGFFLHVDPGNHVINSSDLLHIDFGYNQFLGFRKIGPEFEESAFISLLLVRLTAFTYYAMTGILIVRKIILWCFIIVSPIFPLLLFYAPIRNTAKIWIGEFFRWLMYGPLFALFLHGLVQLWQKGIPLPFKQIDQGLQNAACTADSAFSCYPTAINILLGGPGMNISPTNSVNLKDTFALYVVALLMLWVVTLLPFLLLNIFLDYLSTFSFRDNRVVQNLARGFPFLNRPPSPTNPSIPPVSPAPAGIARALPFLKKDFGAARPIPTGAAISESTVSNVSNIRATSDVLRLTNLSIPKMRDIARYESSMITRDTTRVKEVSQINTTLQSIANPSNVSTPIEREHFNQLREKLVSQKQKGDPVASSILSASQVTTRTSSNSTSASSIATSTSTTANISRLEAQKETIQTQLSKTTNTAERDKLTTQLTSVNKQLTTEKENLQTKTGVVATKAQEFAKTVGKTGPAAGPAVTLPVVNRVQQVSIEDYEEVRKMWHENYQNLEVPKGIDGQEVDRKTWIKNDTDKINQAVTLLTAADPQKVQEGMNMVSNILPFLLIGGFSKSEVIAYLKAKLEAGKSVMEQMDKKQEEEDSMIERGSTKTQAKKEMTAEAQASDAPKKELKELGDETPAKKELGDDALAKTDEKPLKE